MKIKGRDLIKLGFIKQIEKPTLDPEDYEYHYYTFEINDKGVLISNANDERVNGGYEIELYEVPELKFNDLKRLKKLVKILKSAQQ
jgi:hypothetical protein